MLTVTPPISLTADQVWVFVTNDTSAVAGARMAYCSAGPRFLALPMADFDTTTLLPCYGDTGELITGFRWATTTDIEAHADLFTGQNQ
jgi:hypothetical protein